jgi:hypothetical protein
MLPGWAAVALNEFDSAYFPRDLPVAVAVGDEGIFHLRCAAPGPTVPVEKLYPTDLSVMDLCSSCLGWVM